MTSQAVSEVSELKKGPSDVVTSAQSVTPSARSSTSTTVRSRVMPKLVSKGALRRILSLRRVTASICMGSQVFKRASATNVEIRSYLPFATIGERTRHVKRLNTARSGCASRKQQEPRSDQALYQRKPLRCSSAI